MNQYSSSSVYSTSYASSTSLDAGNGASSQSSQRNRPLGPSKSLSLAPAPKLERKLSIMSLPSPPDELLEGRGAPNIRYFSDEEEYDQDTDVEEDGDHGAGSSNRMLVDSNPFLVPTSTAQQKQARIEARPDHPQASPTHQARKKRIDKERIRLGEGDSVQARLGPKSMGKGWNSPSNPFIARDDEEASEPTRRRENRKPDKVTYVFRGKRISYDIPLDALISPEDPEDSPFPDPSPRLLFPTGPDDDEKYQGDPNLVTPPSHSRPTSSFLDALRATTTKAEPSNSASMGLPPTPVTERQRQGPEKSNLRGESRFGPYKRMAAP